VNRTLAVLGCDVRLQARNGFYHAAAAVLLTWALLAWRLSPAGFGLLSESVVRGAYGHVRHPIYGGGIAFFAGTALVFSVVTTRRSIPLRSSIYGCRDARRVRRDDLRRESEE
jgi:hypothetical protein